MHGIPTYLACVNHAVDDENEMDGLYVFPVFCNYVNCCDDFFVVSECM